VVVTIADVPRLPSRARDAHKGDHGVLLLIAGSRFMLGAAILASRAALRSGLGLLRVALPAESCPLFPLAVPAATTLDRDHATIESMLRSVDALAIGPGLGTDSAAAALLTASLAARRGRPAVLDADALNLLAPLRSSSDSALDAHCVLTPHVGEAARLLGVSIESIRADRRAAALRLQAMSSAVVVLKGADTVVTDGERIYINQTGNPGMATGGSGDVLTGVIGALLAGGMPAFDAARLAVHVHGLAGDRVAAAASRAGLCAEDLPAAIAVAFAEFERE
jgi:NAD(P)H-hydrate epimerase